MKELSDSIADELEKVVQEVNNSILEIMGKRIKYIGELSATDSIRLSTLVQNEDINAINEQLARITDLTPKQVDLVVQKAAENNNELMKSLYKANGVKQTDSLLLQYVKTNAIKNITKDILNLSNTLGFNFGGTYKTIQRTYVDTINKAIYSVQSGLVDYNTAMRSTIHHLSKSGIQTVDYASGYSRRLDSAVRMNLLDGVRAFNTDYREQQGKEFGADGVEVSSHAAPAPDHAFIDGRQFTTKEFESLQATLERPIGTMNCRHTTFPIIIGLSEPVMSQKELKIRDKKANELVSFKGLSGRTLKKPRYELEQYQRGVETSIRKMKDERNMLKASGDELGRKAINKEIRAKTQEYYRISEEMGLAPQKTRLISHILQ